MKNSILNWNRIVSLIHYYRSDIILIYFFAILSGVVQLSLPLGIQAIIGFSLGSQLVVSIYVLIFLVVIGVLFVGILNINQIKLIEKIQQKFFLETSIDITKKILGIDLQGNQKYYLPEKVNRYFEIFSIQKGLSKILLDIPIASIQILAGLLLSLYNSIFILFGAILMFILWLILKYTSGLGLKTAYNESNDKYFVASWIEDLARAIRTFKFSQEYITQINRTDNIAGSYIQHRNNHFSVLLTQYKFLIVYKTIITAAMLIVGSLLLIEQKLNIGEFIAVEIVIIMVVGATEKLISHLDSLYDVAIGLEKINELLEQSEENEGQIDWNPQDHGPEIEFKDFNFKYLNSNENQYLNQINLFIPSNSITSIYGEEGQGKTTFLKIVGSLYRNYFGNVLIDNMEMKSYTLHSLRKHIGFYFRNQELFSGTLLENITLGWDDINEEDVLNLMKKLKFQNILHSLEKGIYTNIEPQGKNLSSNQIKKLLILRTLIHKPKLICMDEPFIGLAEVDKQNIMEYLKELKLNTTIIIVSNDNEFNKISNQKLILKNRTIELIKNEQTI